MLKAIAYLLCLAQLITISVLILNNDRSSPRLEEVFVLMLLFAAPSACLYQITFGADPSGLVRAWLQRKSAEERLRAAKAEAELLALKNRP